MYISARSVLIYYFNVLNYVSFEQLKSAHALFEGMKDDDVSHDRHPTVTKAQFLT